MRQQWSVGVPDEYRGETVKACVSRKPGATATAEELIEFCRAGLSAFKRPRQVLFLPEFPLTATGKVQRFRLREHAMAQLSGQPAGAAGRG